MMSVGQRIREQRLALGLSVDELAEKLKKNRATIYRYESEEIENLPLNILEPLAKVLECSPAHLMGWEEAEPNSYYLDPEVAEMAEELKNNPEYRVLLDASRKMSKKDMQMILDLVKRMSAEDDTHHIE